MTARIEAKVFANMSPKIVCFLLMTELGITQLESTQYSLRSISLPAALKVIDNTVLYTMWATISYGKEG
jgi:hypothetical protein